jgi:glutathione S-transferase
MLLYLGEIWGVDKGLFPPPGPERLEAFKWMTWGAVSLGESVFKLLQNTSERWPAELRNAAAAEAARGELSKLMRVLDDQLRGREYVLGAFTLADCAVATMAALLGRIGFDLSPYPQVGAWIGRCLTRPAMARVLAG